MLNDGSAARELNWFPYRATSYEIVKSLVLAQYGAASALGRAGAIASQWLGVARSIWRHP
jgi:hypothetical protein